MNKIQAPVASPVDDKFIRFEFAFVFGNDASHFYGIGQLQLAAGKLPAAVQVGWLDGSRFDLLFDVDDRQHCGRSRPTNRFCRDEGTADGLGRFDLTVGGHMVGQFAFGLPTLPFPDTKALSVERRAGLHFRRFLH